MNIFSANNHANRIEQEATKHMRSQYRSAVSLRWFWFIVIMVVCGVILYATKSHAEEPQIIASYDYYMTPKTSGKHNYEDGAGLTLGVEHSIWKNVKGQATYSRILDVDFPYPLDPKGSWGELRGHIAMYALKYEMPYNDLIGFYASAGIGYGLFDFRENPLLQDYAVKVELENAPVIKLGLGAEINIGNGWLITAETGWWDSDIPKDISDNEYGIENILDSGDIGLQYVPIRGVVRKKF